MRRDLDNLGFYSQALEAAKGLKQARGTPEQMLAMLKKAGVKDAEIQATGLDKFLEGKKAVSRDEIVKYLEENRVGLREVNRGAKLTPEKQAEFDRINEELRRARLELSEARNGNNLSAEDAFPAHAGMNRALW